MPGLLHPAQGISPSGSPQRRTVERATDAQAPCFWRCKGHCEPEAQRITNPRHSSGALTAPWRELHGALDPRVKFYTTVEGYTPGSSLRPPAQLNARPPSSTKHPGKSTTAARRTPHRPSTDREPRISDKAALLCAVLSDVTASDHELGIIAVVALAFRSSTFGPLPLLRLDAPHTSRPLALSPSSLSRLRADAGPCHILDYRSARRRRAPRRGPFPRFIQIGAAYMTLRVLCARHENT